MAHHLDFLTFATAERPRLVGALTLYVGDVGVAEELAQEALVRVRERWSKVAGVGHPGAYTHRVAINLANSRFRRRGAERRALQKVAAGAATEHHDPCGADGLAVRRAVAALPPKQREVVVRRWFLDESIDEVATAMTISASTVRSNTHRGLAALREVLDLSDADAPRADRSRSPLAPVSPSRAAAPNASEARDGA